STGGPTTIGTGPAGSDAVWVRSIGGPATIASGGGNFAVTVASASNLVNTIAGALTVDGGSGADTSLAVVASGTTAGRTVGLDGQTVTGLDLPGSITYAHLTQFSLALGAGHDTVNVNLVAAGAGRTLLDTRGGNDTVNITASQAGLAAVNAGSGADEFNVSGSGGP